MTSAHPSDKESQGRIAVIIPAKNEADRIGDTVHAAKAIPGADLIVVIDDGSTDHTDEVARAAGAAVVRHSVTRGKGTAMDTGGRVVAMRDVPGKTPRHLLFLDADLGSSAFAAAPLVTAVRSGHVDMAIGVLPPQPGAGGHGFVLRAALKGIHHLTGFLPQAPLSGQRCMTRQAFDAANPLAPGWGVEVGITVDVLRAGLTVCEVPIDVSHRATGHDWRGTFHRLSQFLDVKRTLWHKRFIRYNPLNSAVGSGDIEVSHHQIRKCSHQQKPFYPYSLLSQD